MSKSSKVSAATKKKIARDQSYQCANKPGSNLRGLEGYLCTSWNGPNQGYFDRAGYDTDHIIERCMSEDDSEYNLQALCPNCHSCKTRWFRRNMKNIKKEYFDNILSDNSDTTKCDVNYDTTKCDVNHDTTKCDVNHDTKNKFPFVNIVPFGTDSIDSLTIKEIENALSDRDGVVIGLLKHINFNSDKNIHHNILLDDNNNKFVFVYTNQWERKLTSDMLPSVIIHKCIDTQKLLNKTKKWIQSNQIAEVKCSIYNLILSPNSDEYWKLENERVLGFMCKYKDVPKITHDTTLYQQSEYKISNEWNTGWDMESMIVDMHRRLQIKKNNNPIPIIKSDQMEEHEPLVKKIVKKSNQPEKHEQPIKKIVKKSNQMEKHEPPIKKIVKKSVVKDESESSEENIEPIKKSNQRKK